MRAPLALLLSLTVSISAPHALALEQDEVTPFETGDQGGIILRVMLNGRGPFRFLLDTGSTHTAVSEKTAALIGAPVVAKTTLGSVAGTRAALVVRIDALEIGPINVPDLLATVANLGMAGGVDGVIGHDALRTLRYTIDFPQRQVLWWPVDAAVARGTAIDLQSIQGRFLLSLPQRQSVLRLVPDTGASSLLLFDPVHSLQVTHLPERIRLMTSSAETDVYMARMRELRVGDVTLRDIPAVVTNRDDSEPAEVDGLWPLHYFDRVTVDGPGKRLIVQKTGASGRLMFF